MPEEKATREERRAAIEAKRASRRESFAEAREEQYVDDLEAITALEERDGRSLTILRVSGYVDGLPSAIAIAKPAPGVYKRMSDKIYAAVGERKEGVAAQKRRAASDELSRECWVWPADPKVRDAMLDAWPSILDHVGVKVGELMKLEAEEEGKE